MSKLTSILAVPAIVSSCQQKEKEAAKAPKEIIAGYVGEADSSEGRKKSQENFVVVDADTLEPLNETKDKAPKGIIAGWIGEKDSGKCFEDGSCESLESLVVADADNLKVLGECLYEIGPETCRTNEFSPQCVTARDLAGYTQKLKK